MQMRRHVITDNCDVLYCVVLFIYITLNVVLSLDCICLCMMCMFLVYLFISCQPLLSYFSFFLSLHVLCLYLFFFFKQKTAYEMRISDWSSDVCSSDLGRGAGGDDGSAGRSVRRLCPAQPLGRCRRHDPRAGLDHDERLLLDAAVPGGAIGVRGGSAALLCRLSLQLERQGDGISARLARLARRSRQDRPSKCGRPARARPRRSLTRALVGIWPKWPTRCSVEKSMNPPIDAEARMRRTGLARRSVIAGLASLGLACTSWARATDRKSTRLNSS